MGDKTDQLGLLRRAKFYVWDLFQSMFDALAVLDQNIVARDHNLALGPVFRTLNLLSIDEVSGR